MLGGAFLADAAGRTPELARYPCHEETSAALAAAVRLADAGEPTPERVERLGGGWVAEEALAIAVSCALVAQPVRSVLLLSVNHSGDSDSTGAICDNLLGVADDSGADFHPTEPRHEDGLVLPPDRYPPT